jgi:hypothetical protein
MAATAPPAPFPIPALAADPAASGAFPDAPRVRPRIRRLVVFTGKLT